MKAKLAHYSSRKRVANEENNTELMVKGFAALITAVIALCYVLHLVNADVKASSFFWQRQLYWVSNDTIGYTLLIKLVSSVQIGKFSLVVLLYVSMIIYDCVFVFASDVMVTVAT